MFPSVNLSLFPQVRLSSPLALRLRGDGERCEDPEGPEEGGGRVALPGGAGVLETPQMVTNNKRLVGRHILKLLPPV